jgi:hypothetical protein
MYVAHNSWLPALQHWFTLLYARSILSSHGIRHPKPDVHRMIGYFSTEKLGYFSELIGVL